MASGGATLWHLCRCFRACGPAASTGRLLISLANQTLTTPALQDVVEQFADDIPKEVSRYVGELFARNLARNDRLAEQLAEALAALNARGITPMLLKGSAMLATTPRMTMGRRLITDLNIVVSPDEAEPACDCPVRPRLSRSLRGFGRRYQMVRRPGKAGRRGHDRSAARTSRASLLLQRVRRRQTTLPAAGARVRLHSFRDLSRTDADHSRSVSGCRLLGRENRSAAPAGLAGSGELA